MGGGTRLERQRSLLLVLVLTLPLLTLAQAQGGAVLIDEDSFSLVDGDTFEADSVSATLELNEVLGSSANVSITLLVQTLDGEVLSNQTQAVSELLAGEVRNVSVSYTGLPYGHSVLVATLTGEVGSNNSQLVDTVTATVQRLRPLAITLGGLGSVVPEGVDVNGQPTGNLSLHDGDRLALEFPVINNGDINWTGGATIEVLNGAVHELVSMDNLTVIASSSLVVRAEPSLVLTEGDIHWWVNLTGDVGMSPEHTPERFVDGRPTTLARVDRSPHLRCRKRSGGDALTFSLTVWNNASVAFSGELSCMNEAETLFESDGLVLASGSSLNWSFSTSAKPMTVSCMSTGGRVATTSSLPTGINIDMPSAVFESAGSSTPTLSGGPWHKGTMFQPTFCFETRGWRRGEYDWSSTSAPPSSRRMGGAGGWFSR